MWTSRPCSPSGCRPTWCPSTSLTWTSCRSAGTGRSTAGRSPAGRRGAPPPVPGVWSAAPPPRGHEPSPPTDVQRAYWMGRGDDYALGGVGSHWYGEFEGVEVALARLAEAGNRLVRRH